MSDSLIPTTAPHRTLLFELVRAALREEAGVREARRERKPTSWHAGRRSAFIASAARLMETLYGGDYEEAKSALNGALRAATQAATDQDLGDRALHHELAKTISEHALSVI